MKYRFLIVIFFLSTNLFAQSKDDRQLFKKFVTICNSYKQLPLQLSIEFKKSSNIPLNKEDSSVMEGVFYLQAEGGYIRFGNAEQIVTDSFVLMIMNGNKQMILSKYATDIAAQVNNMVSMPVTDSSIKGLNERYTIRQEQLDNETAILKISNKQNVYATELPFETNTLTYNTRSGNPVKIETIKRSLIKNTPGTDPGFSARTVSVPQKGDYLIKEDTTTYMYKTIAHDTNKNLPVKMQDRIEKDSSGNYAPAKAYKNYTLIVN
jgi:hypothetical protein